MKKIFQVHLQLQVLVQGNDEYLKELIRYR